MHRTELAPDRGMLFDFGATRPVTMWMKNTLEDPEGRNLARHVLRRDRRAHRHHRPSGTTPLSEKRIRSGQPVRFVLEMIGGSAQRLGISPGDRLRHALIERP